MIFKNKLSELYRSLSDNQRYNFWIAATNIILCFFTFWYGLTLQFAVVDETTNYQKKILHQEYDTKVEPRYLNMLYAQQDLGQLFSKKDLDKMKEINNMFKIRNNKLSKHNIDLKEDIIQHIKENGQKLKSYYDTIIQPSVYTIINEATKLRYVLPEKEQNEIARLTLEILTFDGVYYAFIDSKSKTEYLEKITEYFLSPQYVENTRIPINGITIDYMRENAEKLYENYLVLSIFDEELLAEYVMLSKIINNTISIYLKFDDELGFLRNISKWDALNLWEKSTIILLITLVIGWVFSFFFLKRVCMPLKSKRHPTRDEYNEIKKDVDNLKDQIEELETERDKLKYEIIRLGNPGNIKLK